MQRIAWVSLVAGGVVCLLFTALYVWTDWPASWFGAVGGGAVALGLATGLVYARRRRDTRRFTRALCLFVALLMGVTGLFRLARLSPDESRRAVWLMLAVAVYYGVVAVIPGIWTRRS